MIYKKVFANHRTLTSIPVKISKKLTSSICQPKWQRKMLAWQIHNYGDLNELHLSDTRVPTILNPDQVLIKVKAASLNPIDKAMIGGYGRTIFNFFRNMDIEFPLTVGRDFCGEIVEKGHTVGKKFNVGDNVYGFIPLHRQGSHAEFAIANKNHILHQPEHLNHVETASIPYATMTAWGGLYLAGGLITRNVNQTRILILGISGGVGTMATQLLKAQGATVIGTCSADAIPLVKSLGAETAYDYHDPNYANDVANHGKFDIILDCAKFGYENLPKNWNYYTYVTLNSPLLFKTDEHGLPFGLAVSAGKLFNANVSNLLEGKTIRWGFFVPSATGFELVDSLVKKQQINPVIHKVFSFNDLPKGLEALAAGHLRGKIVINFEE